MSSLRDLICAGLLLIAMLLGVVWLPGVWLQQHVVQEQGFLEVTQPLGEDADVQRHLSDAAVDELLDSRLVPDRVADAVAPALQDQMPGLTSSTAYQSMWDATMTEVHTGLFAPGPTDLTLDLSPVSDTLLESVEDQLPFGITLPHPDHPTVTLTQIPDVPLLRHAEAVLPWAQWAGPAALVLALLAIGVAAHRRGALIGAGIAALLAGIIGVVLALAAGALVPNSVDQAEFLGPIVQAFETRLRADLLPQAAILSGGGALVVVLGLASRAFVRR
jgi:hypothetical protein